MRYGDPFPYRRRTQRLTREQNLRDVFAVEIRWQSKRVDYAPHYRPLIPATQPVKDTAVAQGVDQGECLHTDGVGPKKNLRADIDLAGRSPLEQVAAMQLVLIVDAIGPQDSTPNPFVHLFFRNLKQFRYFTNLQLHEDNSLRCAAPVARGFSSGGNVNKEIQLLSELGKCTERTGRTTEVKQL